MKQQRSSGGRRISRGRLRYSKKKNWNKESSKENKPKADKEEETFNRASKIGGTHNEFDFVDSVSSQPSYKWTELTPIPMELANIKPNKGKNVPSLKQLCALELTRNVQLIDSKLIDAAPWSIWKLVWLCILKFGQDSPDIYGKFAKRFHVHPSFKAHLLPIGNKDIRNQLVLANGIPGNRLHRFETIFKNTYFDDMLQFIHIWNPLVLLDLSLVKIPRDDYFKIFNMRGLSVLSLCNHDVDNTLVGALCSSFKSGKLSKLKFLKINNTKITACGLLDLFKQSESSSCLSCIETDISMKLESDNHVKATMWYKLDEIQHLLIHKLPLGLKLHTLIRNQIIDAENINISDNMILDLMMVDEVAIDKCITQFRINNTWETRTKVNKRVYIGETFILNRTKPNSEPEEKRVSSVTLKPQSKKKQKRVQLNAKEFFCI